MSVKAALKVICLTLIGAPPILAATDGLTLGPLATALMAILALAAGYALAEMEPGWASGPPERTVQAVADELERRMRETPSADN